MIKLRYLLLILSFFCGDSLFAQSVPKWGGAADQKDISFGFSFSYVDSYFKIDKNANWRDPFIDKDGVKVTDPLNTISSPGSQGFAVGFLARFMLTEHLEARVTPSLVFADRSLTYTYVTPSLNTTKSVQSTSVDLPVSLKIKSDRIGDFRAYILGGVKYSQGIGSRANADAALAPIDKHVKNISGFGSYEAGLGCDIYFEFFKLSPEIKLSNSFGNVLLHEDHPYAAPINKLSLHTLMFSLYFE
ncbi:outer membrane beta-barrel protein [Mucilaginibacter sp. UR6-11]|uniref:type IX secretion/gliding motility protein PorT/SprT n=1 Tax=Mucilaginibacter sp. UR6-11 TaxID=1435644 RepID=UPI001E4117D6|nr:outer membrane beta-barrel protein [Mucilaginibacter sp. UR6-11]MCC8423901.1 PorT family protein [Mucilaginibacter sp. UR6-11]